MNTHRYPKDTLDYLHIFIFENITINKILFLSATLACYLGIYIYIYIYVCVCVCACMCVCVCMPCTVPSFSSHPCRLGGAGPLLVFSLLICASFFSPTAGCPAIFYFFYFHPLIRYSIYSVY